MNLKYPAAVLIWILSRQNPENRFTQNLQRKWFADHQVHAPGRLAISVEFVSKGRGHYDGQMGQELFDEGGQFNTVHSLHFIVRYDQVELALFKDGERRFAAVSRLDCVLTMEGAANINKNSAAK